MRIEHKTGGEMGVGTARLGLAKAILVYESGGASLATLHDVIKPEGEKLPVLLPGRCATREQLDGLLRKLAGTSATHEIVPGNVLCSDVTRLAWWVPSSRRPIFFNTGDAAFNKAVDGKTVPYPALVFVAKPGVLSVFALRADKRPEGKTKLCRAPFLNLYDQGNMCAGDTRLPGHVMVSEIPIWERSFFETRFTHTNANAKLTAFEGGHSGLWRAMVRAKGFPSASLLALDLTLQKAIDQ